MSFWKRKAATPQEVVVQAVEKPVIGEALVVMLYEVQVPTGKIRPTDPYAAMYMGHIPREETAPKRYLTCEQAHAEHPGRAVKQVRAIKIAGVYFNAQAPALDVEPKPKVSKGRAKA